MTNRELNLAVAARTDEPLEDDLSSERAIGASAPSHRRIYVASSWRNGRLDEVVGALRARGHEVYDFREDGGFSWEDVRAGGAVATGSEVAEALAIPVARAGWWRDHAALEWCDTVVLVLPAGSSAHLELGWGAGSGRETFVLLTQEPSRLELMLLEATALAPTLADLELLLEGPARDRRAPHDRLRAARHLIEVMAERLGDEDDEHATDLVASAQAHDGMACLVCGCTELDPCFPSCGWAAEDLCTSCAPQGLRGPPC